MESGVRFAVETAEDMVQIGRFLGERLFDGAVVGLSGPLGAGKTTLARGIAEGLGVDEGYVVSSPTYTIMQTYPCSERLLHHLDLYRIQGPEDLDSTGYRDCLAQNTVLMVEWPEKEPSVLPPENLLVKIEYRGQGRELTLTSSGTRYAELVRQMGEDLAVQGVAVRDRAD